MTIPLPAIAVNPVRIETSTELADGLSLPTTTRAPEHDLYVRYVRALALLCECAPYVDEPDYLEQIETLLQDASDSYPLQWRRAGRLLEIAPRARET